MNYEPLLHLIIMCYVFMGLNSVNLPIMAIFEAESFIYYISEFCQNSFLNFMIKFNDFRLAIIGRVNLLLPHKIKTKFFNKNDTMKEKNEILFEILHHNSY